MFGPGNTNYAPPILQARNRDPRLQYFQALMQQGSSTAPVSSPLEAAARVAQAGIGGFFGGRVNKEYDERQKQYQDALQKAMADENPIAALQQAGNADVMSQFGPQILQAKSRQAERKEARADTLEDRQAQQAFTMQRDKAQQDWTLARDELLAAKQAALQNNSFENQARLQQAQQDFAAAQQNAQQAFTAGQQGKAQAFQAGENALSRQAQQLPAGFQVTPQGMAPIPGGPADPAYLAGKTEATTAAKMNDEQSKAAGYFDRMAQSEQILRGLEQQDKQPGWWSNAVRAVPLVGETAIGRAVTPDTSLQYEQAQRDFINALLRRESGAVISESEFDNARKQYFPSAGDSPAIIEQKRKNRETAAEGIRRAAGPAFKPTIKPNNGWSIQKVE